MTVALATHESHEQDERMTTHDRRPGDVFVPMDAVAFLTDGERYASVVTTAAAGYLRTLTADELMVWWTRFLAGACGVAEQTTAPHRFVQILARVARTYTRSTAKRPARKRAKAKRGKATRGARK